MSTRREGLSGGVGRVGAVIAVAGLAAGCGAAAVPALPPNPLTVSPLPGPDLPARRRDALFALTAARERWRAGAPRAYRLVVSERCFCGDLLVPFESEVRRGIVVSAAGGVRDSGRTVQPALRTVEALFAEVERLILTEAEGVRVIFDPALGYPTRITVDPLPMVADDGMTWLAELTSPERPG